MRDKLCYSSVCFNIGAKKSTELSNTRALLKRTFKINSTKQGYL